MKTAILLCVVAFALLGQALAVEGEKEGVPTYECACTRIYLPVCSTEGRTYPNKCEFDCYKKHTRKNVEIARNGECEESKVYV